MRALVVSERLSRNSDDGIKNLALAFLRELRRRGHTVLGLSEWADIPEEGVERFGANRFYLGTGLSRRVKAFAPDLIVYVPWTSATSRSLFRLAALRRHAGGRARTAIVATQPMPLGRLGRRAARWLRPDVAFVQSSETRAILRRAGIDTAFLASGHDPARFRPGTRAERPALRAELGLDPERPLLVHVGHLKRERVSPSQLRAIAAACPELQLLMVGSPHTPQDDGLAAELEQLHVRLVRDFLPDISRVYRAADVYLFPTRDRFACVGVPLSVIEAMASDLPVVSTPFGGLPELFGGQPGVRFAESDDEIARAVATSLQDGSIPTHRLVSDLTWDRIIGDALELLEAGADRGVRRARLLLSLLPDAPPRGERQLRATSAELRDELRDNKIPVLALDGAKAASHLSPGTLDEARARYDQARQEYSDCRAILEASGIRTVFTKSSGPLPYESDNMDLLIEPARLAEAKRLLERLDYLEMRHYREDWKAISKRFDGPSLRNIVHFHEEVSWGVEPFLDREALWRDSRPSPEEPGIRILSREHALLTVTAHALYENDRIKLGDLWKMRSLLGDAGFDWAACRSMAKSLGWEEGHDLILRLFGDLEERLWGDSRIPEAERDAARRRLAGTWIGRFADRVLARPAVFPLPLSLPVTKRLFLRKILRNPRTGAGATGRRILGALRDNIEPVLRINHQRPFLVSFSGIDGSGKGSVIDAVRQALEHAELRHRVVWVRGGNSALLQAANRMFRALLGRRAAAVVRDGQAPGGEARIVSPFWRVAWPWIVAAEQAWLYQFRVRVPLALRRVVLLDRAIVDTLVDLRIRTGDARVERRLPLRLLRSLAPKPGLAWHLQVEPKVAHDRKREDFSVDALAARAAHYDDLAAVMHLHSVRTDAPFHDTARRVVQETLAAYFRRFPE